MNNGRRYIIIGDVHGCLEELKILLAKANLRKDDCLIFVGDLIDKGPNSVGVVKHIYELSKKFQVILIEGNHDEKFNRWVEHYKNESSIANEMSNTVLFHEIFTELLDDEIEFMQNCVRYFRIEEYNYLIVHAGIPFDLEELPNNIDEVKNYSGKIKRKFELLLRLRFDTPEGKFVRLDMQSSEDYFWAERYDGRFGKVIFGHTAYEENMGPQFYNNAVGIDLGVAYGGHLCALVINNGNDEYFTVKAKASYFK